MFCVTNDRVIAKGEAITYLRPKINNKKATGGEHIIVTYVIPLLIEFFTNNTLLFVIFNTVPKSHSTSSKQTYKYVHF